MDDSTAGSVVAISPASRSRAKRLRNSAGAAKAHSRGTCWSRTIPTRSASGSVERSLSASSSWARCSVTRATGRVYCRGSKCALGPLSTDSASGVDLGLDLVLAQEGHELHPFSQASGEHVLVPDHLRHHLGDLARSEVELLVEGVHRLEDLRARQLRVLEHRRLHAPLVHQVGVVLGQPSLLLRLLVQGGARVRSGDGHLQRVGVDVLGELDRLLDRLLGLTGKADDERAVDGYAQVVAVLG